MIRVAKDGDLEDILELYLDLLKTQSLNIEFIWKEK